MFAKGFPLLRTKYNFFFFPLFSRKVNKHTNFLACGLGCKMWASLLVVWVERVTPYTTSHFFLHLHITYFSNLNQN